MPSEGPRSPSTLANDNSFGNLAWDNPGNAAASDNVYAACTGFVETTTQYLKATGFGFTIPAGVVIAGIVVEIERSIVGSGGVVDERVRIVKGGTVGAQDKASPSQWPFTDAYASYGSANDNWGENWTPADINSSNFGMVISARVGIVDQSTARVDHIRITVYYDVSGQHVAAQVV